MKKLYKQSNLVSRVLYGNPEGQMSEGAQQRMSHLGSVSNHITNEANRSDVEDIQVAAAEADAANYELQRARLSAPSTDGTPLAMAREKKKKRWASFFVRTKGDKETGQKRNDASTIITTTEGLTTRQTTVGVTSETRTDGKQKPKFRFGRTKVDEVKQQAGTFYTNTDGENANFGLAGSKALENGGELSAYGHVGTNGVYEGGGMFSVPLGKKDKDQPKPPRGGIFR